MYGICSLHTNMSWLSRYIWPLTHDYVSVLHVCQTMCVLLMWYDIWHLLSTRKFVTALHVHSTAYTRLCERFAYTSHYVGAINMIQYMASALCTQICDCSACKRNYIHTAMWVLFIYIRLRGWYKYDMIYGAIHGIYSPHTNMWVLPVYIKLDTCDYASALRVHPAWGAREVISPCGR